MAKTPRPKKAPKPIKREGYFRDNTSKKDSGSSDDPPPPRRHDVVDRSERGGRKDHGE